jgi:hypothetical protein
MRPRTRSDDPAMPTPRLSRTYAGASTGKSAKQVSMAWAANCSATVMGSNPRRTEQGEPPHPVRVVVAAALHEQRSYGRCSSLKKRNSPAKTILRWAIRPPLLASESHFNQLLRRSPGRVRPTASARSRVDFDRYRQLQRPARRSGPIVHRRIPRVGQACRWMSKIPSKMRPT